MATQISGGNEHRTARLTVLVTPAEKRAIETRARLVDMTPSEWVRTAAQHYEPVADEPAFVQLADAFEAHAAHIQTSLRAAIDRFDAKLAAIEALRASHRPA